MLVQVVKSQSNLRQQHFLEQNGLRLERVSKGRWSVLRKGCRFDGSECWFPFGYVFSEGPYHIYVPYGKKSPECWYFGITRCDAISGYLSAKLAAAPADQKEG